MKYQDFIAGKRKRFQSHGIEYLDPHPALFPFQREIVRRALAVGRFANFADCGLGKTLMQLEWASKVPGRVIMLAPLAVSYQIESDAQRFGFDAKVRTDQSAICGEKIVITNYEKLSRFEPDRFNAVSLDESSILKSYTGKIRTAIIESFRGHRFKLASTATPSPNDFMELGNHAEFLGAMSRTEMLAMYFVHDGGSTQDWRLKGHAVMDFWRWVASWASMVRSPSDLGFDDAGFQLPPMTIRHERVESGFIGDALIPGATALDIHARRSARRGSISARAERAAEIDAESDSPMLLWCDLNDEGAALSRSIPSAVEVAGSTDESVKADRLLGFSTGKYRVLVTKPRIGGWGMNWQHCSRMAFVGLSDSYESFYQATRRCWRFGQQKPVDVRLIYSDAESAVVENVLSKERGHREMQDAMAKEMRNAD